LFFAVLVLGTTAWIVYANWSDSQRDAQIARSNRAYLRDLNDIVGNLKDAESGQRGFILTGQDRYLEPYTQALKPVEESLQNLEQLASERPDQQKTIEFIRSQTRVKLKELAETIQLRRTHGFDAALNEVLSDRGRIAMNEIRRECGSAAEEQYVEAAKRSAQARNHQQNAIIIASTGGVTILGLMAAGFLTLISGARQQAQMAEKLADSREMFEKTLTSIGDAVIATDTSGRITFLNPVAVELTGWTRDEADGKHVEEVFRIIIETTREKAESPFDKVMRSGSVAGLANHTLLIRKDGSDLPIDDSGAPIRDVQGKVNGVVLVFRDIADRRKAEAALEHSHNEVLTANEELRQFSYAATHDLKEPLRTIVVFSQLLARGYKPVLDARGQHLLQTVEDAANRMSALIDDLLSYTRAGGMETSANRAAVKARDVLADTLVQLHGAIAESGAAVTFDPLPMVWSDAAQLSQVFQNLISNSIKYRKPDVIPAIHIAAATEGDRVTFRVSDNGIGFKQEYSDRIFLLFQRLHGRAIPGTGIGLALCRRIVERHGGKIWARSQENVGTTFYFTLPVAEEKAVKA
jgi:PAS domain S-box-containing protein